MRLNKPWYSALTQKLWRIFSATYSLVEWIIAFTPGLHNSESSKAQIDQFKFSAGRKSLFRCSLEEILKRQVIIRSCTPQNGESKSITVYFTGKLVARLTHKNAKLLPLWNKLRSIHFHHLCAFFLVVCASCYYPLLGRLAALDLGAGVEQPFNWLIIQNNRPCRPWGGRWIWHRRTTWSTVCSSAPHSQAQRRPYSICASRSGNVRHQCGGG